MGVETAKALRARRREAAARIDRLIAQADQRSPLGSTRRARIMDGARLARRRAKALAAAQQTVKSLEVELGQALLRVADQGLSRNEAFELVGLRRHLGRRYVDLALRAQDAVSPGFSTASAADTAPSQPDSDSGRDGTRSSAGTPERKR